MEEILYWLLWCPDCSRYFIVDNVELNESMETQCPVCRATKVVCKSVCSSDYNNLNQVTLAKVRNCIDKKIRDRERCEVYGSYLEDPVQVELVEKEDDDDGVKTQPEIRLNKDLK